MAPRSYGPLAIARGDEAAFERAYDEHARGVFSVACRVLGNSTQAQDVVQDVFLSLWRDPTRFDARRGPIGHYLRMVARSRAIDILREAHVAGRANDRMRLIAEVEEGPVDQRPVAAAEREIGQAVLRRALMRLPDVQREAIVLAYWGGLTADEIAESSGTPVGTVKSRIRLGLMKLREQCAPDLGEQPLAA
jgi:RNA polymerase sigma-70 factor (ECF subfamily)